MNKVTSPTGADATDKAKVCKYAQGLWACYPPSCCEDAKSAFEDVYKIDLEDCALKCGDSLRCAPGPKVYPKPGP